MLISSGRPEAIALRILPLIETGSVYPASVVVFRLGRTSLFTFEGAKKESSSLGSYLASKIFLRSSLRLERTIDFVAFKIIDSYEEALGNCACAPNKFVRLRISLVNSRKN